VPPPCISLTPPVSILILICASGACAEASSGNIHTATRGGYQGYGNKPSPNVAAMRLFDMETSFNRAAHSTCEGWAFS